MQDMKTSKIKLNEASEVEEFVKAAGKCDFDIDIFYNRVIFELLCRILCLLHNTER